MASLNQEQPQSHSSHSLRRNKNSFDIFKLLHHMGEWEYLKLYYISVVKSKLILQKHEIISESYTSVLLRSD